MRRGWMIRCRGPKHRRGQMLCTAGAWLKGPERRVTHARMPLVGSASCGKECAKEVSERLAQRQVEVSSQPTFSPMIAFSSVLFPAPVLPSTTTVVLGEAHLAPNACINGGGQGGEARAR